MSGYFISSATMFIWEWKLALAVVLTVDTLLVDLDRHHKLLVSSFSPLHTPATSSSSVATLVKRLQES